MPNRRAKCKLPRSQAISHVQVVVALNGQVVHMSPTYPGHYTKFSRIWCRSVCSWWIYQGVESTLNGGGIVILHRQINHNVLAPNQTVDNAFLSSIRVEVEYTFGRTKRYQLLRYFRSIHWWYNSVFRIVAALHNIEQDFIRDNWHSTILSEKNYEVEKLQRRPARSEPPKNIML